MLRADLNADLGEGLAPDLDGELFQLVTSANIACGGHAGDLASMLAACEAAVGHGVAVGAHPSYEDRPGFGRDEPGLAHGEIRGMVVRQLELFAEASGRATAEVSHVKPHGALYHRVGSDPDAAAAFAAAVAEVFPGAGLVGSPGSMVPDAASGCGLRFIAEGFADRGYGPDGVLVRRGELGATLTAEEAGLQALRLLGLAERTDGLPEEPVETICIHGDGPNAVEVARSVRLALEAAGVELVAAGSSG